MITEQFGRNFVSSIVSMTDVELRALALVATQVQPAGESPRLKSLFNDIAAAAGAEQRDRARTIQQMERDMVADRVEGSWRPSEHRDTGSGAP